MAQLSQIPLVFSFKQVVLGNGFIAGVRMDGRALMEIDKADGGEEVWLTGIAPVGITGGGADRSVAFAEFRNAWAEVVFDIAHEADSFDDFERSCKVFLSAEQDSLTRLWLDAVDAVRREQYVDPSLRREENAEERRVKYAVVDLTDNKFGTAENKVEKGLQVAA